MRFPPQAQKKHGNSVFKQKILAIFSRGSHHKPRKREIPFSNRRYWQYFPEVPITSQNKQRKSCFQIEDIGIIFQRFPSQAPKKGNPVFKQKILALFSRGSHHTPKKREIPFSNEVPITSPEKNTEIPFSNRRYWHYFPEVPITSPKKGNPVFKQKILALFSRKAQKDTEILFSNEVPITSPEKTRKFRFQIENIGIIFQRLPSQAQKREIPFSNRRYWHYFPEAQKDTEIPFSNEVPITSPEKHGNSVFKQKILILFSRGCHHKPKRNNGNPVFKQKILALFSRGSHHKPKKREIPFSNRRYWHYFPEKPKKTRKSRFQMRFPSQAQKKTRKFRFQIEDIGIIFQRFPSQAQKKGNPVFKQKILALFSRKAQKDTEIPFSNEAPTTSPEKTRKFRFQIEDIDIIFQRLPSQAKKTTEIPFSKRKYWHYFPEVPITSPKKGKSRFQIEDIGIIFPNSQNKIGRQTIFKQKILSNNQWGSGKDHFKQKIFIICTCIYPYLLQILKTRLADKPFSNRRYCQTTNGEAEKTISNRRYSLYQPQIFRTRLCDKPFFKQKIFGWMIHQVCAFGVGLNGF